jgi:hypothetical protein
LNQKSNPSLVITNIRLLFKPVRFSHHSKLIMFERYARERKTYGI